jgi:hypothetical protein
MRRPAVDLCIDLIPRAIECAIHLVSSAIELPFETRNRVFETLSPGDSGPLIRFDYDCAVHVVFEPPARQYDHADHERIHPEPAPSSTHPSAPIVVSWTVALHHRRQAANGHSGHGDEGQRRSEESQDSATRSKLETQFQPQ